MAPHFLIFSLVLLVLTNGESTTSSGMVAQELSSLHQVMSSLLDDPATWVHLHPHPCTDTPWPGIQCETQRDSFLHVTKIHVGPDVATPACKEKAELPHSLLNLPYLKTISIFNCFVIPNSTILPPSLFANTSSLEQIIFISNPGLVGPIPASLMILDNLRVLSLSQNNLQGSIPENVGKQSKLQQLDLSYNQLTGKIPDGLGQLSSLTILDLSANRFNGSIPASLGNLHSLQKIDISSNLLSGKIPQEIGSLRNLVLLDLSRNAITGPIPESLSGLEKLEYFLIEENPLQSGVPLFLGEVKSISVVGLSGCGLSGPIPSWFVSLKNLTALTLDRNRLNGTVPKSLDALGNLGQLNLSQNMLSGEVDFEEEFVSRLGKRLDVRDNKGLCAKSSTRLYFETPVCLDSRSSSAENGSGASQSVTGVGSGQGRLGCVWLYIVGFFMYLLLVFL